MTLPLLTSNIFLSALVSFMFLDSVCIYVYCMCIFAQAYI